MLLQLGRAGDAESPLRKAVEIEPKHAPLRLNLARWLMAHWARAAAGRFTTIQYEGLVRDFETAGPALLAACGLDWEPACRTFWERRGTIGTMSFVSRETGA